MLFLCFIIQKVKKGECNIGYLAKIKNYIGLNGFIEY
jgi:hypothetical protein